MDVHPPGRVLRLGQHGDAVALLGPDGQRLTHAELAALTTARADSWGPERRLVLVEGGNRLDALVAHLAALEHGHVSLLVPPRDGDTGRDRSPHPIAAAYRPDIECTADGDVVHRATSAHTLHPDLALLSSTSGSTGSPKLVRLSARNVTANAESIADYLALGAGSRALTSLPLHYCYGLSVVHSHLLAGGSLVLTEASVVDDEFWQAARTHSATSFAGVPYTFDLLAAACFDERRPDSLRQITQAGGRMAPERVREWAGRGAEQGWDLVVMYGQTEATARMAYLPPHLAGSHPHAIGQAVPGGHLRVEPVPESDQPGVGELVYTGPNVMMGYAERPEDLGRGAEVTDLRTGDLGRERDGLFEVVGRRSGFAKIFGLRLDLGVIEAELAARGTPAELTWTEDHLHAFLTVGSAAHSDVAAASREVARSVTATVSQTCQLPARKVRVHVLAALPRTLNGKVDRQALDRLAALDESQASSPLGHSPAAPAAPGDGARSEMTLQEWVVATAGWVLGRDDARSSDSFVALGGDSLSYVELTVQLEDRLGQLPAHWHTLTFADLAAAATTPDAPHDEVRPSGPSTGGELRPTQRLAHLDTTIVLRALAIVAIVASHVDRVSWEGGAHLLLALAGYNFARFQLATPARLTRVRHALTTVAQLLVPAVVWVGVVALWPGGYDATTALLLNGLLGAETWDVRWQLWFLEALAWIMLTVTALLALPAAHRWERRSPFGFALAVLTVAALVRFAVVGVEAGNVEKYTTGVVAFFFVLGWVAARATTLGQRLLVTALTAVLTVGFFGDPAREGVIVVGVALVVWAPRIPVPRRAAPVLVRISGTLATYSLFVYLTHWQVYPPLEDAGHPWLALLASFGVGIAYGLVMRPVQRWLVARLTPRRENEPPRRHLTGPVSELSGAAGAQSPNPRHHAPAKRHTIDNWRARRMPPER
ncbi:AMP-binding protein [Nocardioides gilvus]|uniref:AMP-binding protein n=1 Tax=Nocardioides gilvus TaxID=1735589 RepID=UPI000D74309B|nr:AMP-binding protein [Nocardioides gilvus]